MAFCSAIFKYQLRSNYFLAHFRRGWRCHSRMEVIGEDSILGQEPIVNIAKISDMAPANILRRKLATRD